ncbi:MAG: hypothetical protein QOI24_2567 [Acidobacteriota bacterium]|nr:hypothetical protein [Acidobacteriota bacterium]
MAKAKQHYDPHPGVAMVRKWIDTLKEKTGHDLDEWVALVLKEGPPSTKDRRDWLKKEHNLGTNSAAWIVDHAEGKGDLEEGDPKKYVARAVEYVDAMLSGSKAGLRPIYDALYDLARSIADDTRLSPGKTIVSIYRNHVIAQIKPTTRTRIDLGFALGDTKPSGRLTDTGGLAKGNRITHRIGITSVDEIDAEVKRWLKKAYELDS